MFLPVSTESQPALVADLEADPFVGHTLSSATCDLVALLHALSSG